MSGRPEHAQQEPARERAAKDETPAVTVNAGIAAAKGPGSGQGEQE